LTLTLFFFFISGCDFFGSNKQIKEQVADLIILPFQKISLSKTDNFDAYEAAINGEYTCFVSQLAPEGSPFKYQYHQIKLLFAPRLLTEISDLKVVQGLRYSLDEERSGDTKRYARCLFPKSEKLSRLLLQHLQFDPTQPLPENLMIDETSLSSPLSKTANTFKMICSTTTITSTIQGVTYPSVTRINYDDCIEIHIEFLTPPDLPAMPIWDYEQYAGGGGGVGGDVVDSNIGLPPKCPSQDEYIKKYYCNKDRVSDLNATQTRDIKEIIALMRKKGGVCTKLADIGDMLLAQNAIVVAKIESVDREGHEPLAFSGLPKGVRAQFSSDGRLEGVAGAWITIDPKNWDVNNVQYLGDRRITLEWVLVHEFDHILLGDNIPHISYTYAFGKPPNTTLYTENTRSCSSDALMSHSEIIL